MRVAQRHHVPGTLLPGSGIGCSPHLHAFSLVFALILAVLFTILLLLFMDAIERSPRPAGHEPHAVAQKAYPHR